MPSTATLTAFYSFTASTVIKSAEVNHNFSTFRGHIIPVDPTATSSPNRAYDLGSSDHSWRGMYSTWNIMFENTATTVPSTPSSSYVATYFKDDQKLYRKNSSGTETEITWRNVVTKTASASLTASEDVIFIDPTSSGATFTLQPASSEGREVSFFKTTNNNNLITIGRAGSDNINGATSFTLYQQYDFVTLVSDGSASWAVKNYNFVKTVTKSESAVKVPTATDRFHSYSSGNNVTIGPGVWDLDGGAIFDASGAAGYTSIRVFFSGANGTDTSSLPATALSAVTGLTINSQENGNYPGGQIQACSSNNFSLLKCSTVRVTLTQQATIYVVTYAELATAANGSIRAYITATRVG